MRSTRQESVLVNARRSRGSCVRSRSSSVTALRCEPLECCDIVVLHVVEEGGKTDVTGPRIRNDPRRRKVAHPVRGVLHREHDDRRAVLPPSGHLGPEAHGPSARGQGLGYIEEIGVPAIRDVTAALTEDLIARARAMGLRPKVAARGEDRSAIVMLPMEDPADRVRHLAAAGIIADARPGHVRLSPFFYNVQDDYVAALERLAAQSRH